MAPSAIRARLQDATPALLVVVAALAAHHQALLNGFLLVDDPLYVTANQAVRAGLTFDGAGWAFTSLGAYNWHPLTWLSHMADVTVWGLEPFGHHLTSWLLHAANALLVYLLFRRATGAAWRSVAVALLFAVHPVHVESVAWVAERKDVLSTFLFLLALLAYVGHDARTSVRGYALTLALFVLSLMAKQTPIMTPVLLVLLDVWPLRRLELGGERLLAPWSALLSKAPFFAISAAVGFVTLLAQNRAGQGAILYESPWHLNAGNALLSYVHYLGLLAWPAGLAFCHPFSVAAVTWPAVAAAAATLVAITWAAVLLRRSRPYLLFGWLWYLIALLPVIGFLRFGYHALAERYLYIPALGIYVAVVWGIADLAVVFGRRNLVVLAGALAAAVTALAGVAIEYGRYWRSTVPLLERAVLLYPDNPMPHKVLGAAYAEVGRLDRALEHTRAGRLLEAQDVVAILPDVAEANHQLGVALAENGRTGEAVVSFRRALALDGMRAQSWNSLGIALASLGQLAQAREAFQTAVGIAPGYAEARHNLEILSAPLPTTQEQQRGSIR